MNFEEFLKKHIKSTNAKMPVVPTKVQEAEAVAAGIISLTPMAFILPPHMPRKMNKDEQIKASLETLANKKGNGMTSSIDIVHDGSKIILPIVGGRPMAYREGAEWLLRREQFENERMTVHQRIGGSPLDGAVAFTRALMNRYGWVQPKSYTEQTMFGKKIVRPKMVGVPIGPNGEQIQVPVGHVMVPGIEGYLETSFDVSADPAFIIKGEVLNKYRGEIHQIVQLTQKFLKEESIYKGKAIRADFSWVEEVKAGMREFNPLTDAPGFMGLNPELESNLVFSDSVQSALDVGLFTLIENTQACRDNGIPLKRGVLLAGPYGTGKTLTANIAAIKAQRNGWTFIYLNDIVNLQAALRFAAQYAPAVLFAEDIDRVTSGERTISLDMILNTLDGVDTKSGEIITVFTTNHLENVNPALLRMGRLDALIEVLPPDAKAAAALVRLYGRGLIEEGVDLDSVGEKLKGKIPAFIREVVERSKMAAIHRTNASDIRGHVTEKDLMSAAEAMEIHNSFIWKKGKNQKATPRMLLEVPASLVDEDATKFLLSEMNKKGIDIEAEPNGHNVAVNN